LKKKVKRPLDAAPLTAKTDSSGLTSGLKTSVTKKIRIFDELMKGFRDAIARKKGRRVALRITSCQAQSRQPGKKKIGPTSGS
jgi:hypothetical protein